MIFSRRSAGATIAVNGAKSAGGLLALARVRSTLLFGPGATDRQAPSSDSVRRPTNQNCIVSSCSMAPRVANSALSHQ